MKRTVICANFAKAHGDVIRMGIWVFDMDSGDPRTNLQQSEVISLHLKLGIYLHTQFLPLTFPI